MLKMWQKMWQYPRLTASYPREPFNSEFALGAPQFDPSLCTICGECVKRCPTTALTLEKPPTVAVDLARCIFCSHCVDICPAQAVQMSHCFELAALSREELGSFRLGSDQETNHAEDSTGQSYISQSTYELIGRHAAGKIKKLFGRSLQIREVDAGSCNGCDYEINALNNPFNDLERLGIHFVASPRHADMLLVTGPAARNMEQGLIKTYNATADPKLVVAVGACACSGGIFRESPLVRAGIDTVIPVDAYIPGCPPRPQALLYGILKALDRLEKPDYKSHGI